MLTDVKTTIEMNDELFRRAKRVAASDGVTLKELIETGLRAELERRRATDYVLPDATFDGDGVAAGITEGDWDTISALIYPSRGG